MKLFFHSIILFLILLSNTYAKQALKDISLQLQWKYQFQFAGFIMAKEKGFYKDIGLDVNIKELKPNINFVDEVIMQNSNYALARSTVLMDIANGKNVVLLGAIYQSSPLVLVATKKSGIKSVQDFKNKRIMSSGDMNTDASLLSMMFSQGINTKDMILQQPSFNVKDLIDGKTDLMASYISNEPFLLKELGVEPIVFSPKDYGFDFYNDILITSNDYMQKNPKEVEQFRSASLQGWEYAFSHIDETVDILYDKYNTQHKSKQALKYEGEELKKLAYYQTKKIGKIKLDKLQQIYSTYKLLGLSKGTININKFIYKPVKHNNLLSNEEKNYLKNKKNITMCIDPDWMPFEKFENGKHIGISADYFKEFEKSLNITIKPIITKSWSESLQYAKNRKCDILSLAMETPNRKKYMNFTLPYLQMPLIIATKLNVPFIDNMQSLENKKIGITKGYAFVEILKNKYPNINIIEVKNIEDGLNKVQEDKLFGYIGTLASVGYAFQHGLSGELKIAGKFDEKWNLGIAVRDDDKILLDIFNKIIKNIDIHKKQKILNDWISIKYEKGIDYKLIWNIVIIVFIIILVFLYRQYMLKKSINRLDEIMDTSLEGIMIYRKGSCIELNQVAVDIFGYNSKDEMIGITPTELTTIKSQEYLKKQLKLEDTKPYELSVIKKDGTVFDALIYGHTLKDDNLRLSCIMDISNIKKQERIIAEQSKLASMGEMIGNIAHQWRQPLSVISTGATGMQMQKEYGTLSDTQFKKTCETINNNAQYLSKTIDDFRNFIKGDRVKEIFNLRDDVKSFLHLVEGSVKSHNINIILNLDDNIEIDGYQNELIQCFINIFNNAKDILKEKNIENKLIFISTSLKNDKAIITFKDNAGGIPKDVLPKIFEPYFTTKHKSQGTGLGLHMTYTLIVEGMNGNIEAKNTEYEYDGKKYVGAEFSITL